MEDDISPEGSSGPPDTSSQSQQPPDQVSGTHKSKWSLPRIWKIAAASVTAVFWIAWWCYSNWPRLEISDQQSLDAADPYAWIFVIRNSGSLWAGNLQAACFVREVVYDHGYQSDAWNYADAPISSLGTIGASQQFGLQCPKILWVFRDPKKGTGEAVFSNNSDVIRQEKGNRGLAPLSVRAALIEIQLSYSVVGLLPSLNERRRFIAVRSSAGSLKWRRAGPTDTILHEPAERCRFVLQRCRDAHGGPGYQYVITAVVDPKTPPPACEPRSSN